MMIVGWGEQRFWEDYEKYKDAQWKYGAPRELLRVDWKSEKYRDFSVPHPSKITPKMVKCLKRLLVGDKTGCNPRTIKALQWRDLCDDQSNLTEHGTVIAMQGLSLKSQCKMLNIPLETWHVHELSNPEETVLKKLNCESKRAYFTENSFTNVINFFLLGELVALSKEHDKTLYTIEVTQYPELFYLIKRNLDERLQRIGKDTCKNNFDLFLEYFDNRIFIENPIQDIEFYENIFDSFGIANLQRLIVMYFSNPLAYSWRGWPDIFVTEKDEPHFVEVKTTDKLHLSQLVTIPDLINLAGVTVRCVQLKD